MADNPSDLVGKEFIFKYGVDRILPPSDKTGGVFATEQRAYRRERVVRCRDCKHAECYESGLVGPFILCSHFESEGCKAMVEPSGFCAWGERGE